MPATGQREESPGGLVGAEPFHWMCGSAHPDDRSLWSLCAGRWIRALAPCPVLKGHIVRMARETRVCRPLQWCVGSSGKSIGSTAIRGGFCSRRRQR